MERGRGVGAKSRVARDVSQVEREARHHRAVVARELRRTAVHLVARDYQPRRGSTDRQFTADGDLCLCGGIVEK